MGSTTSPRDDSRSVANRLWLYFHQSRRPTDILKVAWRPVVPKYNSIQFLIFSSVVGRTLFLVFALYSVLAAWLRLCLIMSTKKPFAEGSHCMYPCARNDLHPKLTLFGGSPCSNAQPNEAEKRNGQRPGLPWKAQQAVGCEFGVPFWSPLDWECW